MPVDRGRGGGGEGTEGEEEEGDGLHDVFLGGGLAASKGALLLLQWIARTDRF